MFMIKPKDVAPDLEVESLDGELWRLSNQRPKIFTMIVFYRGWHCPSCREYLRELDRKLPEFLVRGVEVIAISSDSGEQALAARQDWNLGRLKIGYGLNIEKAREWGLFISKRTKQSEPQRFSEPGLFLIKPDKTVYAAFVQSTPFARPNLDQVLAAIDFMIEDDYPARGEA